MSRFYFRTGIDLLELSVFMEKGQGCFECNLLISPYDFTGLAVP